MAVAGCLRRLFVYELPNSRRTKRRLAHAGTGMGDRVGNRIRIAAIHLALKQAGYEVGQTVRMEYRYANNQLDQLPGLAAEL